MKKGQLDFPIFTFAAIVVGLILFSIFFLKFANTFFPTFSSSLGNMSSGGGEIAQENVNYIGNITITFWDKIMMFVFVVSVIVLFISAFLIDAHPFWVFLYIIAAFILILFAPTIISAADHIYESSTFSDEVNYSPFMDAIRINYVPILVGIIFITGIIIYGKLRFFGGGNNPRRNPRR